MAMTAEAERLAHEGAVMAAILRGVSPHGGASMGLGDREVDKALARLKRRNEVVYDRKAKAWVATRPKRKAAKRGGR